MNAAVPRIRLLSSSKLHMSSGKQENERLYTYPAPDMSNIANAHQAEGIGAFPEEDISEHHA